MQSYTLGSVPIMAKDVLTYIEFLALIMLILVFGATAHRRNIVWNNELSLWSDVVKKASNKARPYNNLGESYREKGLQTQARSERMSPVLYEVYCKKT